MNSLKFFEFLFKLMLFLFFLLSGNESFMGMYTRSQKMHAPRKKWATITKFNMYALYEVISKWFNFQRSFYTKVIPWKKMLQTSKKQSHLFQLYKPKHGMAPNPLGQILSFAVDHAIMFADGHIIHQYCEVAAVDFPALPRCALLTRILMI